jgi:transcriptional regulator with XRE-family HTH domain
MNERLRELRKYLGLSQRALCAKIGMTQSTYAALETGARDLRDAYLKLICNAFKVNEDWLRYGEGDMFLEEPNKELEELLKVFDKLTPALQRYLVKQARGLLELQKQSVL